MNAPEHEVEIASARERLLRIFRNDLNVAKADIEDDDELVTELGLDSVNIAIGLIAIEDEFRIELNREKLMNCNAFGDLLAMIRTATSPSLKSHGPA